MKIKTSELTGAALDWAVAKCEGEEVSLINGQLETLWTDNGYKPSTNWALGGPIIERERICLKIGHDGVWLAYSMQNYEDSEEFMHSGLTPLVAAMRCYVASKLGNEVEIPDDFAVLA